MAIVFVLSEANLPADRAASRVLIIAATALLNDLTIVTRDQTDFDKAQVKVLNPWTDTTANLH